MIRSRGPVCVLVIAWSIGILGAAPAAAAPAQRFAIVVGANQAPPGRAPLRYAHADAQAVAEVLVQTGGVDRSHLTLLLDPQPGALLAALDRALASAAASEGESLFFFYYSGHADPDALFPAGVRLPLSDVRPRLGDTRADVRVGIIDACRGGGWTGSKGLTEAAPFEVDLPRALASEGLVLIASSSGLESAHESEALGGSFFTHHWNAALRGAADRDGDARVTITEAFTYAREMTVRDTARVTEQPQHPSFRMDVRGRADLVVASLEESRAVLALRQRRGPLQLVDLRSGVVTLEAPPGAATLRLALPPGRYLVRRREGAVSWATEVEVTARTSTSVDENDLSRVDWDRLASKDVGPTAFEDAVVAPRRVWVQAAAGIRHAPIIDPGLRLPEASGGAAGLLRIAIGITPRWHLVLPLAVAYAAGESGATEWVPWAGLPVLGGSSTLADGFTLTGVVGAGLDLRDWLVPGRVSLNASVAALGFFQWAQKAIDRCGAMQSPCQPARDNRRPPNTWAGQVTVGASYHLAGLVTFNLGGGVTQNVLFDGTTPMLDFDSASSGLVLALGSVQRRGLLPLPLVRVHLGSHWALDGHVAWAYVAAQHAWQDTYLGGVTALW